MHDDDRRVAQAPRWARVHAQPNGRLQLVLMASLEPRSEERCDPTKRLDPQAVCLVRQSEREGCSGVVEGVRAVGDDHSPRTAMALRTMRPSCSSAGGCTSSENMFPSFVVVSLASPANSGTFARNSSGSNEA